MVFWVLDGNLRFFFHAEVAEGGTEGTEGTDHFWLGF